MSSQSRDDGAVTSRTDVWTAVRPAGQREDRVSSDPGSIRMWNEQAAVDAVCFPLEKREG